jgi:hypothetical protein
MWKYAQGINSAALVSATFIYETNQTLHSGHTPCALSNGLYPSRSLSWRTREPRAPATRASANLRVSTSLRSAASATSASAVPLALKHACSKCTRSAACWDKDAVWRTFFGDALGRGQGLEPSKSLAFSWAIFHSPNSCAWDPCSIPDHLQANCLPCVGIVQTLPRVFSCCTCPCQLLQQHKAQSQALRAALTSWYVKFWEVRTRTRSNSSCSGIPSKRLFSASSIQATEKRSPRQVSMSSDNGRPGSGTPAACQAPCSCFQTDHTVGLVPALSDGSRLVSGS